MTRRGRAVVLATALTVAFGAGLSAQLWNPYTRHLDRVQVHVSADVEEDEAECVGTREIGFDRFADGSASIVCAP